MPGSPPIRVAEPGTKPPPATRSNSSIPVATRGSGLDAPERSSNAKARPAGARRADLPPTPSAAASSMIVFHSPQDSHLPCQRWVIAPQFWQTYEERGLAMGPSGAFRKICRAERAQIQGLALNATALSRMPAGRRADRRDHRSRRRPCVMGMLALWRAKISGRGFNVLKTLRPVFRAAGRRQRPSATSHRRHRAASPAGRGFGRPREFRARIVSSQSLAPDFPGDCNCQAAWLD